MVKSIDSLCGSSIVKDMKGIIKNAFYATSANSLSMLASVLLSFVLPKFVSIVDYGYWQFFILYSGYVGFLHLGFCDGLYLRYGGKKNDSINFHELSIMFSYYLIFQILVSAIIILIAILSKLDFVYKIVLMSIGLYAFIANTNSFFTSLLLSTNRILLYSRALGLSKILLIVYSCIIMFIPIENKFLYIIGGYLFTSIISVLLLLPNFKGVLFNFEGFSDDNRRSIKTMKSLVFVGFVLMLSNVLSHFILGSGRMIVEYVWDVEAFAKLSFAVSISMFFLAFVSQLGMVLFPLLKNMNSETVVRVLNNGDFLIGYIMMWGYFMIIPISFFIYMVLPAYVESVNYILILLPTSLYIIKSQILYTTYLKSINMQNKLLLINMLSVLIAVSLYILSALFRSLQGMAIAMLVGSFMQYILQKSVTDNILKIHHWKNVLFEAFFSLFFIGIYMNTSLTLFIILMSVTILIYTYYNRYIIYASP